MKKLKLAHHDPILVDLEALRRSKPRVAIDLKRPTARADAPGETPDAINVESNDPLAAIIALSRRRTRR
jgi:hypothetical protein